jgi:hypothetical protein
VSCQRIWDRSASAKAGGFAPHMKGMADENLTHADRAELARVLCQSIDADRFPLSPRVRRWKALLAKLDPQPAVEPYPPAKGWTNSTIRQKGRRRVEHP